MTQQDIHDMNSVSFDALFIARQNAFSAFDAFRTDDVAQDFDALCEVYESLIAQFYDVFVERVEHNANVYYQVQVMIYRDAVCERAKRERSDIVNAHKFTLQFHNTDDFVRFLNRCNALALDVTA